MHSPFVGEFVETLVLVLLGDGVVANVVLKRSKAEGTGWMVVTTGWCFAVLTGVLAAVACGSGDAHINPAIALGFAVMTGNYSNVAPFVIAQMLGAFAGVVFVWLHFLPHWKETPDASLKLSVFCTAPAIRRPVANVVSEIIGTFVFVFVAAAIASNSVAGVAGLPSGLGAYLVSCLVWGIGLSLGGTTGYAINPARDLAPRLVHAVLPVASKGKSDWGYAPAPVRVH
jgi:glycerol uptake facilitator protein